MGHNVELSPMNLSVTMNFTFAAVVGLLSCATLLSAAISGLGLGAITLVMSINNLLCTLLQFERPHRAMFVLLSCVIPNPYIFGRSDFKYCVCGPGY